MAIHHIPDGGDFRFDSSFGFSGSSNHRSAPDAPARGARQGVQQASLQAPGLAAGGRHHGEHGMMHPHGHHVVRAERHASGAVVQHHEHGGFSVHHADGHVSHHAKGGAACYADGGEVQKIIPSAPAPRGGRDIRDEPEAPAPGVEAPAAGGDGAAPPTGYAEGGAARARHFQYGGAMGQLSAGAPGTASTGTAPMSAPAQSAMSLAQQSQQQGGQPGGMSPAQLAQLEQAWSSMSPAQQQAILAQMGGSPSGGAAGVTSPGTMPGMRRGGPVRRFADGGGMPAVGRAETPTIPMRPAPIAPTSRPPGAPAAQTPPTGAIAGRQAGLDAVRRATITMPVSDMMTATRGIAQAGAAVGARQAVIGLGEAARQRRVADMRTPGAVMSPESAPQPAPIPGAVPGAARGGHITAAERHALPSSDFALPGERYPIQNPAHARNALSRVSQFGTPSEKGRVRGAVHRKYPDIGER